MTAPRLTARSPSTISPTTVVSSSMGGLGELCFATTTLPSGKYSRNRGSVQPRTPTVAVYARSPWLAVLSSTRRLYRTAPLSPPRAGSRPGCLLVEASRRAGDGYRNHSNLLESNPKD